ncbi:PPE domain-containing protein [Amycolatopsis sacchari]|uniref:PPE domain-containing protein n=1 Tax=Amycolatopsis sacchari TaxID=115433 RepID=UPI003D7528CF
MTNPQQPGNQGLDDYTDQGGKYTSPQQQLEQQLIAEGYDPNSKGFFDAITNFVARSRAEAASDQQRSQQTRQLSQGVEFRDGLQPSNYNYLAMPHEELKTMVQTVNPSQVTGVSTAWTQLANAMATFGQQLGQAANKSGVTWKGEAAESAFNFVSGLGTWSDQSGQAAQLAADQVYNQSSAAETAKNSMPDPIPFSWTDEIKSWASANPFNLVDKIDASFEKQQQSQEAHEQAAQVMSSYDSNLYSAAAKAPAFSPPPTFEGPGAGSLGHVGSGLDGTGSSGYTGPTGGNIGSSVGATGGQQGGTGSGVTSGSVTGSLSGLTGTPPPTPALSSGTKTGGRTTRPGGTTAQGFQPGGGNFNSSNNSGQGTTGLGMGGLPMAPMGGFGGGVDGDEYSSKVGRGGGGGFGPGGSAASSGSAAGGGAGAGAQSGARAGGAGAAETAAGGGRGGAGAAGRGGMGGMGTHGGRGKGSEDEEHQRPSWLIEPDPDDVFGTTERTAPPVIGE